MGTCCTIKKENVTNPITLSSTENIMDYIPKSRLHCQTLMLNEQLNSFQKERWILLRDKQKLNKSVVQNFEKIVLRNVNPPQSLKNHLNSFQLHSSAKCSESYRDKITGLEEKQIDSNIHSQIKTSKRENSKEISTFHEINNDEKSKNSISLKESIIARRYSRVDIATIIQEQSEYNDNVDQKIKKSDLHLNKEINKPLTENNYNRGKTKRLMSLKNVNDQRETNFNDFNSFDIRRSDSVSTKKRHIIGKANRNSLLV